MNPIKELPNRITAIIRKYFLSHYKRDIEIHGSGGSPQHSKKDKAMGFLGDNKNKPAPFPPGVKPGTEEQEDEVEAEDVLSFEEILEELRKIFIERRKKYGNHLTNTRRFPNENISGIYLKCTRLVRMIENGEELDEDTLNDIAIYAGLILSARRENN